MVLAGAGSPHPRRRSSPTLLPIVVLSVFLVLAAVHSARCLGAAFAGWAAAGPVPQQRLRAVRPALPEDVLDAASLLGAELADQAAGPASGPAVALAALALAVAAGAAVLLSRPAERADGAREEDLPPWADMVSVMQDVLSGKPFDDVLLRMRERHGNVFRIYVPYLFGETTVLMGLEANQFVFTVQDKNLDQALGGVVGTAVSGKKTMGTKERKATESGQIFDKASNNFFSNKIALRRAAKIFVNSAEDFCDRVEREIQPQQNVFELLWRYVVQTNADMLYGEGENAGSIVCTTIDSINKQGLFSPQVRKAGDDLRTVLIRSYEDRINNPQRYEGEDSLFEEFFKLSNGSADPEMLQGFQQFMLTLQLAANGNQLVTIRWLMSHVYADPSILEGVRAEVRAKLAQKGAGATIRSLELDDLLDLRLTNACITEAVRLHSDIPSKLTLRQADIDMEFGGYKIPKGATIFLYADAVHKDEKYFPNSGAFCPHRYTNPEVFAKMQLDREIVAFGHGRKRCTGELHARAQISALLASFVDRFDMDLVTKVPGNKIPEDHDGPFIFDTANTLLLVNPRKRANRTADGVASQVPATAVASLLGQLVSDGEQRPPPAAADADASASESKSGAACPFRSLFGGARPSQEGGA